jgi:hypothetical protein
MNITNQSTPGLIADEINLQQTISGVEAFSPKQYSPEIASAFDRISKLSLGDQCPPLEIFKQSVGRQLMEAVYYHEGFIKKLLKQHPKKKQKDIKLAVMTHVLTEMIYNGFRVGWEWGKNGKPENRDVVAVDNEVVKNEEFVPPVEVVTRPYEKQEIIADARDEIINYVKKQYELNKPLTDKWNVRMDLISAFVNEVLSGVINIIDRDFEIVEIKEDNKEVDGKNA